MMRTGQALVKDGSAVRSYRIEVRLHSGQTDTKTAAVSRKSNA